jgi:hypothetical protein
MKVLVYLNTCGYTTLMPKGVSCAFVWQWRSEPVGRLGRTQKLPPLPSPFPLPAALDAASTWASYKGSGGVLLTLFVHLKWQFGHSGAGFQLHF